MEERNSRLLLAIFLSFSIWMVINFIFFPPQKNVKSTKPVEKLEQTNSQPLKEDTQKVKSEEPVIQTNLKKSLRKDIEIKNFYIRTSPFLVELTNKGGRIEKYFIKNYKDLDGKEVKIAKDPSFEVLFNNEKYLAIEITRGQGFDFNLGYTEMEAVYSPYNQIPFEFSINEQELHYSFSTTSLDQSFKITKEYKFFPEENYFLFNLSFSNLTNQEVTVASETKPIYFRSFGSLGPVKQGELNDRELQHYFRYYYNDGSFKDSIDGVSNHGFFSSLFGKQPTNFEKILSVGDGIDFLGTGSRYFIAVLDPLDNKPYAVVLDMRAGNTTGVISSYNDIKLAPNETRTLRYASYVGIREMDGMAFRNKKLDPNETKETPFLGLSENLNKSFNQGLTTPFRNAIVWLFKKMYDYAIPNYGWCIIVFAILFKLVFYPLNQKQAESMKKLQELKPYLDEINIKYANDPQTRQKKTLEIYQQHKVNPMGGCLPILIQIPIFVALYTAFSDTIDLWKSPFLWIQDLSEPDTIWTSPAFLGFSGFNLNILPLIMVGTQIVQTLMTQVSSDPNQKTMMYVMPVIMLFFFWSMPSGVTLYWTIQNILSILQQWYTNKFSGSKDKQKVVTVVKKP